MTKTRILQDRRIPGLKPSASVAGIGDRIYFRSSS